MAKIVGILAILLVAFSIVLLLTGCSQKKVASSAETMASTASSVPDDFELVIGMMGMQAGRMQGYTVNANGIVISWEGKYEGENVRKEVQLTEEQLNTLWAEVEESRFFEQPAGGKGVSSHFVRVMAEGESKRITWNNPPGTQSVAGPVQQLYLDCSNLIEAVLE